MWHELSIRKLHRELDRKILKNYFFLAHRSFRSRPPPEFGPRHGKPGLGTSAMGKYNEGLSDRPKQGNLPPQEREVHSAVLLEFYTLKQPCTSMVSLAVVKSSSNSLYLYIYLVSRCMIKW